MKHIKLFESFLSESIDYQRLTKKISDILGEHYKVSYDEKTDSFFVESDIYKNKSDSTEFYEDVKEELMSEGGIEIGHLEVYSNTEISFTIIKEKK